MDKTKTLKSVLDSLVNTKKRVRVWYGNPKTGKAFNEENENIGHVVTAPGFYNILLQSRRGTGGAILDEYIVKIVDAKKKTILWQHPDFSQATFTAEEKQVLANNLIFTKCENNQQAEKLAKFMNGEILIKQ